MLTSFGWYWEGQAELSSRSRYWPHIQHWHRYVQDGSSTDKAYQRLCMGNACYCCTLHDKYMACAAHYISDLFLPLVLSLVLSLLSLVLPHLVLILSLILLLVLFSSDLLSYTLFIQSSPRWQWLLQSIPFLRQWHLRLSHAPG